MSRKKAVVAISKTRNITNSENFLHRSAARVRRYSSIESFFSNDQDKNMTKKEKEALEHHMMVIRNSILEFFRRKEKYVSRTLIEEILFQGIKAGEKDISAWIIKELVRVGVPRQSAVIVPLHSFSIYHGEPGAVGRPIGALFNFGRSKFMVFPQTNNLSRTLHQINQCLQDFGMKFRSGIGLSDFEHLVRSKKGGWLTSNPLLVGVMEMNSWEKYENVFFVRRYIDKCASALFMFSALSNWIDGVGVAEKSLWGTGRAANYETLDLNHYLTVQVVNNPAVLSVDVSPMTGLYRDFDDTLGFNLEMRTDSPRRGRQEKMLLEVEEVVEKLFSLEARSYGKKKLNTQDRLIQKILGSISFYRKSFASTNDEDLIVNLSTAFESLLLDYYGAYEGGLRYNLCARMKACVLAPTAGLKFADAVGKLYESRCEVVHSGKNVKRDKNFAISQAAYFYALNYIVSNIHTVIDGDKQPIRTLFGDQKMEFSERLRKFWREIMAAWEKLWV